MLTLVSEQPFLILFYASAEEFVSILEPFVHSRLILTVGLELMNSELIVYNINGDIILPTKCFCDRRLAAASRTRDKINVP